MRGHPEATAFIAAARFTPDAFQVTACQALEDGRSVLVAAPTGSGKTFIAEFAVHLALEREHDTVVYTTPIKALSNQKYRDLVDIHGPESVGLLTGDVSINPSARVVVMTTEVLRNMLYADDAPLRRLRFVVMDEVHYLADRSRGAVWEEVILQLPPTVRLVCLSATVSNAEEFGAWLEAVRGDMDVIVSEHRPVPLEQHVLTDGHLLPLFDEAGRPSSDVRRAVGHPSRGFDPRRRGRGGRRAGGPRHRGREQTSSRGSAHVGAVRLDRAAAVRLLERSRMLPAIVFIFSRVGCDQAAAQVVRAGVRLTDREERSVIRRIVQDRVADMPADDLGAVGFPAWLHALECGVAAHHAGLLPVFKEIVEELFLRRLVKVVFATETLALGVNMPARTVVLEKLEKFNGEARVPITAGEYTQLTGRAGRRGIDVEGHAVIVARAGMDLDAAAALASRRTYPLRSSFTPTYNMAVNLVDRMGREAADRLLESSFAQFQADRSVVDLAAQVRAQEESLAGYAAAMSCDRGDFAQYAGLRRRLSDVEKRRGDRLSPSARETRAREIQSLRRQLSRHPCHACPDREAHARWAARHATLQRRTDKLRRQIATRTGSVARRFDRVLDVLTVRGCVAVDDAGQVRLTDAGRAMRGIVGDRDLLVAESIRARLWSGLDAAQLATMACCLVYEPRGSAAEEDPWRLPGGVRFRRALEATRSLWAQLDDLEHTHDLPGTPPVALGLADAMHAWARGAELADTLDRADVAAGDFVRWSKQTIDLLDQLGTVRDRALAATARDAVGVVRRGIVAYSSL